ncbi:DUF4433 domain-containing protein [Verminephrobacter aporrectodeae]|nr:DUF4433 domain-containing protein [Verminephrobacter aporrectodeae]
MADALRGKIKALDVSIHSAAVYGRVVNALSAHGHRPTVEVRPDWYY